MHVKGCHTTMVLTRLYALLLAFLYEHYTTFHFSFLYYGKVGSYFVKIGNIFQILDMNLLILRVYLYFIF